MLMTPTTSIISRLHRCSGSVIRRGKSPEVDRAPCRAVAIVFILVCCIAIVSCIKRLLLLSRLRVNAPQEHRYVVILPTFINSPSGGCNHWDLASGRVFPEKQRRLLLAGIAIVKIEGLVVVVVSSGAFIYFLVVLL